MLPLHQALPGQYDGKGCVELRVGFVVDLWYQVTRKARKVLKILTTQEALVGNVSWSAALEVFAIGFGGVFTCLLVLLFSMTLFSRIAARLGKQSAEAPEDKR